MRCLSSPSSLVATLLLCCFLQLPFVVIAEYRDVSVFLQPDSTFLLFLDGYIVGPGYIDLTELSFHPPLRAPLPPSTPPADPFGELMIDVVVFYLPEDCARTGRGCDWTKLGVGGKTNDDDYVRYCCSDEASDLGLCDAGDPQQYGRIILNTTTFRGTHLQVPIPRTGRMNDTYLDPNEAKIQIANTGKYTVAFTNCNDEGRTIIGSGRNIWKSSFGYLPGQLGDFMYTYSAVAIGYLILMLTFGYSMVVHSQSRLPLENWIISAVAFGFLSTCIQTLSFLVWNVRGKQSMILVYVGLFASLLRKGVFRCLLVSISWGWGVIRDTRGCLFWWIVVLGIIYIGIGCASQFTQVKYYSKGMENMSIARLDKFIAEDRLFSGIVTVLDIIFTLWVLFGLCRTMATLRSTNQTVKLRLYRRFLVVLVFTYLAGFSVNLYGLATGRMGDGLQQEQHTWLVMVGNEVVCFVLLIGIASLWWPNKNARDYAYVSELACTEEKGNDMEMVPSAVEDVTISSDADDDEGLYDDFAKR